MRLPPDRVMRDRWEDDRRFGPRTPEKRQIERRKIPESASTARPCVPMWSSRMAIAWFKGQRHNAQARGGVGA